MLSSSSHRSRLLWLIVGTSLLLILLSGQISLHAQEPLGSPGDPAQPQDQAQTQDPTQPSKGDESPVVQSDAVNDPPPGNDNFANAIVIGALPYTNTQSTVGTTDEVGQMICGRNSVWYRYTPATSGTVTINTGGSDFDTMVAVGTGTLGAFAGVSCTDDTRGSRRTMGSYVMTAGITYHIMVAGYIGSTGNLTLRIRNGLFSDSLDWIDPLGTLVSEPIGVSWTYTGANTYDVYLVNTAALGSPVLFEWGIPRASICDSFTCGFNLTERMGERGYIPNGTYRVWVRPGNGAWIGPNEFRLNAPPPSPVTGLTVTSLNTLRPTVSFDSSSARMYNIVVWPAATFPNNPVYTSGWQRFSVVCRSGLCNFTLPVNLQDNTSYVVGVQGYGPGGYSVEGQYDGWAGANFTIDLIANPPVPTNLSVSINNGQPALAWTGSADVSRHYVSIYSWTTNAWVYGAYHNKVGDPALTCTAANVCTLLTDAMVLPNGNYSFYVNSEGAGGASVGGTFNNGFAEPLDGANTGEAGDFGFNLPIAGMPNNLTASTFGNALSLSFTDDPHANRYNIWVGTANGAQTYYYQTHSALSLTCITGNTCVGQLVLPTAIPAGSTYYVGVQGVGPGGALTNGGAANGGAANNGFTISAALVAAP